VCCSCGLGWSGNGKRQCGDLVGRKLSQVFVHDLIVREHAGVRRADHHGGQVFHGHATTKLAEDAPGVAEGPLARGLRAETRKLTARERGESWKLRDDARRGPKGEGLEHRVVAAERAHQVAQQKLAEGLDLALPRFGRSSSLGSGCGTRRGELESAGGPAYRRRRIMFRSTHQ